MSDPLASKLRRCVQTLDWHGLRDDQDGGQAHGRLIHKQDTRLEHQAAGGGQHLLLAAR